MDVYTKPELVKRKNYFRDLAAKHEKRVKELEAENSLLKEKLSLIEPDDAIYFTRE